MEERIIIINNKGSKLAAVLRQPDLQGKAPMVVICHGLGSHKDSFTYVLLAEELEKKGIASLRFDFSCHGESEGSCEDIHLSQGVEDLKAAMKMVKEMPTVDLNKVALFGRSFGGGVVLRYINEMPYSGPVSLNAPAIDLAAAMKHALTEKGIAQWEKAGYFVEAGDKKRKLSYEMYKDALSRNPYETDGRLQCKILIVHGDSDEIVPVAQSLKLKEALGDSCQLVVVEGADHSFEPGKKEEAMAYSVDFFYRQL